MGAKYKHNEKPKKSSALNKLIEALYRKPIQATRGGPLFNAFPYPTKISPEAIALFIASHTNPGDTVLDCFAGSGTTGMGAILCAKPTERMKKSAKELGFAVRWGPRNAILYEIGVLGSFIGRVLCSPPDPVLFLKAAEKLIKEVEKQYLWVYEALGPQRQPGTIRYIIWSDMLQCPSCRKNISLWDACVSRNPAKISGLFKCSKCGHESALNDVKRVTSDFRDGILGEERKARRRQPVWIYGSTNGQYWNRPVRANDYSLLARIDEESIPACVPKILIPWGDLHRSGYHEGITHLHHFYTRRNLIVFSALWDQIKEHPPKLRDALRFWLLSYNASHATIMTRVVAKQGQKDLVVTSAQPGVLYVSGLPVEKNLFLGLRRKLKTIVQAFKITYDNKSSVDVRNESCLSMGLQGASVDYLFTDPPFGGNIPYAEVNFLNEAWLGQTTNITDEVIVSPYQKKTVDDYKVLLQQAFKESYRVLKRNAKATVVFHSASAKVWNALRTACETAGFGVTCASVLDKTQGSFKQVTTEGAVRGDPLILLSKDNSNKENGTLTDVWDIVENLIAQADASGDPNEITPQRIYSRLVGHYVACHQEVPISAPDFYHLFKKRLSES
jgi:16S rRNA G966 N2-methylase RsmD